MLAKVYIDPHTGTVQQDLEKKLATWWAS